MDYSFCALRIGSEVGRASRLAPNFLANRGLESPDSAQELSDGSPCVLCVNCATAVCEEIRGRSLSHRFIGTDGLVIRSRVAVESKRMLLRCG